MTVDSKLDDMNSNFSSHEIIWFYERLSMNWEDLIVAELRKNATDHQVHGKSNKCCESNLRLAKSE